MWHDSCRKLWSQEGLTLVEMVATIALMGILLAMATGGLSYYFTGKALDTSAREVTTEIREAQAMAVSTGNTHRIFFDTTTNKYTLERRQGSTWTLVRGPISLEGGVAFASSAPSFGGDTYMEFYARGTCEDGQLLLEDRYGRTKLLQVDGETANVSVS